MAHILLIDDEDLARTTIRRFLERDGHRVSESVDGNQGLRFLESTPVDLLITDIIMPEKEGLEVIRTVRRSYPVLRIIAVTGGGGDMSRATSYAEWAEIIGADEVLKKPFTREEITAAVDRLLSQSHKG